MEDIYSIDDIQACTDFAATLATYNEQENKLSIEAKRMASEKEKATDRIVKAMEKMSVMHELRAIKEAQLQKLELSCEQVREKLRTAEPILEQYHFALGSNSRPQDDLIKVQMKLKEAYIRQHELQGNLRGLLKRREYLYDDLTCVMKRQAGYKEKAHDLRNSLKIHVSRHKELQKSINKKLQNVKDAQSNIEKLKIRVETSDKWSEKLCDTVFRIEKDIRNLPLKSESASQHRAGRNTRKAISTR